jgi:antitoxin protein of toxin-antitoxin system
MGILDRFKKQAETMVDKHGDQISKGLDKAAGVVDSKTKGKHTGQIDKGVTAAKNALDKLDGKNDDITDPPTAGEPPTPGGRPTP